MSEIKLPELPEPSFKRLSDMQSCVDFYFTADQMREYAARAVREAVKGFTLVDHNYTWYRSDLYHSAVKDTRDAALEEVATHIERHQNDICTAIAKQVRALKSASVSEQKGDV